MNEKTKKNASPKNNAQNFEGLQLELLETMTKASQNVIAFLIIKKISNWLKLQDTFTVPIIASLVFSVIIWSMSWIINRLFNVPISMLEASQLMIPALLAGFLTWLIKVVEEVIFIGNFNFLMDLAVTKEGIKELNVWFKKNFILAPQYALFFILGIIGIASSTQMINNNLGNLQNHYGIYVGIFFCAGAIGQGTYFALMLPTIVMTASKHRLNLYPYNPVKSPTVNVASSVFGILALGTSVAATSIMILILSTNPWGNETTRSIALGWLIYIWSVSSYTFLFPHYFIYKGILEEKRFQLNKLDMVIKDYQSRIENLEKEDLEKLKQLIELREKLASTRNSPIDMSGWGQYLTSLIFPALSFIGGVFDIKGMIDNFFP